MPDTQRRARGLRMEQEDLHPNEDTPGSEVRSFTLRVLSDVIAKVDEAVAKHPVIRNRNTWIANAIVEQLKREGCLKWG